jgi:MoaA/NifB/PqqE/SkfB family radical SAM enzyme
MAQGGTLHKLMRDAALAVPSVRRLHDFALRTSADHARLSDYSRETTVERDRLAGRLQEVETELRQAESQLQQVRGALSAITAKQDRFADPVPSWAPQALVDFIGSGADLESSEVRDLAAAVERFVILPGLPVTEKLRIHQQLSRAIFARSAELYSGKGLPPCLMRYTYPAFLSILLNTHCNAACFFCREADHKGTAVEFAEVLKLDSAIRQARVVDLTGWGEPFLWPEFERVVEHILRINASPQLIQVTTNGSLLSKKWGQVLSGKIHLFVISLNAATSATYENQMRYKNAQFTFDRILKNLRAFLPMLTDEDRERTDIHMVANTDNFREMSQLVHVASDLGIPQISIGHYISGDRRYMHKTLWNVKQEYNDELAKAQEIADGLGIRFNGRKFFTGGSDILGAANCMAPFEQMFIETSGITAPCCFMGNERIGNVFQDGFEAVWFSDTMNKLRQERFMAPCKVCTVFSPFDEKTTHISATLLTKADEEFV